MPTVLSKLPDWGHCVVSIEVSNVSHEDSNSMFELPDPWHIWVSVRMNIWLWVCIVLSNFQQVSVKFNRWVSNSTGECQIQLVSVKFNWWVSKFINYISVYKHTSCEVGVVRGFQIVCFVIAWVSSWGIFYERSSPKLNATIAETVRNLQITQIFNHPNWSLSCT